MKTIIANKSTNFYNDDATKFHVSVTAAVFISKMES